MPRPRRRLLDDDEELVEFVELDGMFVELDGLFVELDGVFVELDGVFVTGLVVCSEKDCVQHEVSSPQQ